MADPKVQDEGVTIGELLASGALSGLLPGGETGFAVVPKEDCPHVLEAEALFCDTAHVQELNFNQTPCADCADASECWVCLHCHELRCSRYVKGHAAAHASKLPEHCVAISLRDMSVWCFACDSYITYPKLRPLLAALEEVKFSAENGHATKPVSKDPLVRELEAGVAQLSIAEAAPVRLVDALDQLSLASVAKAIRTGKCKKIVVMSGAGIR
jgi:Zn-finger in ubiquitin-hydrolases and other protein